MCYPWSNHSAISVLQRRKPGKKEKEKKQKTKTKQSSHMESHCSCPSKYSFSRKNFPCCVPPPLDKKKTQQNKDINKKRKTIQNKTISQKTIIIKTARRRGYKRTTFMSTPSCINTYCERNEGELNDFIA